jgi:hypothetical protein
VRVVQLVFSIGVFRFTKLQFSSVYLSISTMDGVQFNGSRCKQSKVNVFFLNPKYCYLCRVCQKGRTPKKVHDLSLIYSYSANVIGDGDRNTKKLKQVVLPDVFIVHRKRNRKRRSRNPVIVSGCPEKLINI